MSGAQEEIQQLYSALEIAEKKAADAHEQGAFEKVQTPSVGSHMLTFTMIHTRFQSTSS